MGDITPSVIAYGDATLPLLSLRDIFPRSGGSRPSRGRLIAVTAKFPAELKGSPSGELSRSD